MLPLSNGAWYGAGERDVNPPWVTTMFRQLAVAPWSRTAIAPVVSLYVNDFNASARAAYRRVGFREVGRYASVLF